MTVPSPVPVPVQPRAGRLLPRPGHRAAGHHRHLLHRSRPGPRRHPVLPVRVRGGRPRRRAAACPGGWPTRTPSPASTTAAARRSSSATRRTDKSEALLRAYGRFVREPRRPLRHGLRRRHLRRRHGRRRQGDPVRHRPQPRPTAGPATPRCSPRTACSRACGPARSTCGAAPRWPAARSGSPASARWAACSTAHLIEDGAHVVVTDVNEQAVRGAAREPTRRCDVGAGRRGARQGRPRRLRPVRSRRRPRRRRRSSRCSAAIVCGAANNQLADEGEHGTAARLMERGITYAPDFLVNAGGVIQVSDELHGFELRAGPQQDRAHLRPHRRGAAARRRARHLPRGRGRPDRRGADGVRRQPRPDLAPGALTGTGHGARAAGDGAVTGGHPDERAPVTAKVAITL